MLVRYVVRLLLPALLMMAGAVVVAKRKHTQRSLKAAVDTSIEAAEERYVVFLFLAANIVRSAEHVQAGPFGGVLAWVGTVTVTRRPMRREEEHMQEGSQFQAILVFSSHRV